MAKIFSREWMDAFAKAWNADNKMTDSLAPTGFNAIIGYGFKEDDSPQGIVEVHDGLIAHAGDFAGEKLDWDLRADLDDWNEWLTEGFGFNKLGVAVANGKLVFKAGDYRRMIRNPEMAKPFLRHFELMQNIKTEFNR